MDFPLIDIKRTGKRLQNMCEAHNMTASDLQKLLHLGSVQAVYHWFRGDRLPNLDNFYAISRLLNVPMDDLLVGQADIDMLCLNLEFEITRSGERILRYWERIVGSSEKTDGREWCKQIWN